MGGCDMARITETAQERASKDEELLASLRERYPDKDIAPLAELWLVLPKGTPFACGRILGTLEAVINGTEWPS
jgi:hypothetical protein